MKNLERDGIQAAAIHGNKSQPQRERALGAFKTGHCRVLVATDIAARGIDVEAVSHVINFELPNVPESYVHRIGRTARAGAAGIAISFCNDEERVYLRDIEKLTRQQIPVAEPPAGFTRSAPVRTDARPAPAQPQRRSEHRRSAAAPGWTPDHSRHGQDGRGRSGGQGQNRSGAPGRNRQGRQRNASAGPANGGSQPSERRGGEGGQLAWLERARSPR